MHRSVFFIITLIVSFCSCLPVNANQSGVPEVVVTTDKSEAYIGDVVRLEVRVTTGQGTDVQVQMPADIQPFSITNKGITMKNQQGKDRYEFWYDLTCYETGNHEVPVPIVTYTDAAGSEHTYRPDPVSITIMGLLPPETTAVTGPSTLPDIKDIKGLWNWTPFTVYVPLIIMLFIIIALIAAVYWWRTRHPRVAGTALQENCLSPYEAAMQELRSISSSRLLDKGLYKQYYIRLSTCLRRYLQEALGLPALEMTTNEFMQMLDQKGHPLISAQQKDFLGTFLATCDLVKFANHRPDRRQSDEFLTSLHRFITGTRSALRSGEFGSDTGGQQYESGVSGEAATHPACEGGKG